MKLLSCVAACLFAVSALAQPEVDRWRKLYEGPAALIATYRGYDYAGPRREIKDQYQDAINGYLSFLDSLKASSNPLIRQLAIKASNYLFAYPFDGKHTIAVSRDFATFTVIDKNYNPVKQITGYEYAGKMVNGFILAKNKLKNYGMITWPEFKSLPFIYMEQPTIVSHNMIYGFHLSRRVYQTRDGKEYGRKEDATPFKNSRLIVLTQGNREAMMDSTGKMIVPYTYQYIHHIGADRIARVSLNRKYGLIDDKGKIILPLIYDDIGFFGNGLAPIEKNDSVGLINEKGEIVLPLNYKYISQGRDQPFVKLTTFDGKEIAYYPGGRQTSIPEYNFDTEYKTGRKVKKFVTENNRTWEKKALVDSSGNILIPFLYRDIIPISEKAYLALSDSGRWFVNDFKGNRLSSKTYSEAVLRESGSYANVYERFLTGIVDKEGREVIAPAYEKATVFGNVIFATVSYDNHKLLNMDGREIISFERLHAYERGLIVVSAKNKYSAFDYNGNPLSCDSCRSMEPYSGLPGRYIIASIGNGRYRLYNYKLEPALPFSFTNITVIDNNTVKISHDGIVEGYDASLNKKDIAGIKPAFTGNEGLQPVARNHKYGFMNRDSAIIIPCEYDYVRNFYNNRAAVKKDGKWGFIDRTCKLVVPCKYEDVNDFCEGMAGYRLYSQGNWGYLDYNGKEVTKPVYTYAEDFKAGFGSVSIKGQGGWVNKKGDDDKLAEKNPPDNEIRAIEAIGN